MMVYGKLLLTAFFWGGTFIAGRALAGHVAPFSAAFLRFAVAAVFLLLFLLRAEGRVPALRKAQAAPVLVLGMTGVFAYNYFFFKGLQLIEAGRAAVIIANNPIGIALFSALLFKERLSRVQVAGILLSVAGAVFVVSRGRPAQLLSGGFGLGELLIFGCVLSWVTFSLVGRSVLKELSPLAAIFYASLVGTAALLLPACGEGLLVNISRYRVIDWLAIFYLGFFGTVAGFVWYYDGIKKIGPTKAGLFINFVPVSAVALAFFMLGEPITPSLFVGTLLVVGGVFLTNRRATPATNGRDGPGRAPVGISRRRG
ncbi:MAG: DMT family transporter [Desulfobacterales bacterium]